MVSKPVLASSTFCVFGPWLKFFAFTAFSLAANSTTGHGVPDENRGDD